MPDAAVDAFDIILEGRFMNMSQSDPERFSGLSFMTVSGALKECLADTLCHKVGLRDLPMRAMAVRLSVRLGSNQ